uniref:Uncharacterized protein n=1 Tax=Brassica oleracea var. oleracea TaxID=109376 RepID=A0A0D3B652_BRAOL
MLFALASFLSSTEPKEPHLSTPAVVQLAGVAIHLQSCLQSPSSASSSLLCSLLCSVSSSSVL